MFNKGGGGGGGGGAELGYINPPVRYNLTPKSVDSQNSSLKSES